MFRFFVLLCFLAKAHAGFMSTDDVVHFDQKLTDKAVWDFYIQTKGATNWPPMWRTRWKPNPCAWDGAERNNPAPYGTRCLNVGWHPIPPKGDGGLMYLEHLSGMAEGPVPELFKVFQMIDVIDLHGNKLSGTIWNTSYHNFLHRFDLSNNQFEGTLGDDFLIRCKIHCETINFGFNGFSGTLPRSLSSLTGIVALILNDNQFEGSLQPMGALTRMSHLNLANNNKISGTIGDWFRNCSRLAWVEIDNTAIGGTLPPPPPKLSWFTASGTKFSGPIPAAYGDLAWLRRFDCTGCDLQCPTPDFFGHLTYSTHCKPPGSKAWQ